MKGMSSMRLTGYSDRWSVSSAETIRFHVSCASASYSARLVRLRHGDENPQGPGFKASYVSSALDGRYPGRLQEIHAGSYVRVDLAGDRSLEEGFTLIVWFRATLDTKLDQGVMTQWDPQTRRGFGLFIDGASFKLQGRLATSAGVVSVQSQRVLRKFDWYAGVLTFDPRENSLALSSEAVRPGAMDLPREIVFGKVSAPAVFATERPLLLAATHLSDGDREHVYGRGCFNGRLSCPGILARALGSEDLRTKALAALHANFADRWLARWDLARDAGGRRIIDPCGGRDGVAVNRPTRVVTGHNWDATTDSFHEAPEQYCAIHFHDDDLEDACWQESFRLSVPKNLRSGIYAVELTSEDGERDYLPFFVTPASRATRANVAVLIPTLSYLAYSNFSLDPEVLEAIAPLCPFKREGLQQDKFDYIDAHWIKSTYNHHRDGSGISHASLLRPSLTSMRPNHREPLFDGPHQLGADLHLIDWLEAKQIAYDVITDHELHRQGAGALRPYRCILTGTHAEYWSKEMLEGLDGYQSCGGRMIYLSGNGLYWVTALDAESQTVCEVRRANGTRAWQGEPGEARMSFSGEPGGLWSVRGRAPQRYVGVGFTAQGFDRGAPYERTAASRDARVRFLFDGITDELIGDLPALVLKHGAAGYELDRSDAARGTPAHALVIARSLPVSDSYQFAIEQLPATLPGQGGRGNPNVCAEMVFYETPRGGAVFSVGSIAFCSTLSCNDYENNVSRLLENAVRAFASREPLPDEPSPTESTGTTSNG